MNTVKTNFAFYSTVVVFVTIMVLFFVNSNSSNYVPPSASRFATEAFEWNRTCNTPVNKVDPNTFEYSYGVLASGMFTDNKYPVRGSAAKLNNVVCLNVTVPLLTENINNMLDEAIAEVCSTVQSNITQFYLNSKKVNVVPSRMQFVVIPVLDTSYVQDNIKHIKYTPILGTAYQCNVI